MESILETNHGRATNVLVEMIQRLRDYVRGGPLAVVLYGAAVRGEKYATTEGFHILIVVADLEPKTLRALSDPVRFWLRRGQPMPRIVSPSLIADAADVFPLELLAIKSQHELLAGRDPFSRLVVRRENLRLQCEREFREKLMRLREGYVECDGRPRQIRRLLRESYPSFVEVFRGCLFLSSNEVPVHDEEVVEAFCAQAEILHGVFGEVEDMLGGNGTKTNANEVFCSYYAQLTAAVDSIDRFSMPKESRGGGRGH